LDQMINPHLFPGEFPLRLSLDAPAERRRHAFELYINPSFHAISMFCFIIIPVVLKMKSVLLAASMEKQETKTEYHLEWGWGWGWGWEWLKETWTMIPLHPLNQELLFRNHFLQRKENHGEPARHVAFLNRKQLETSPKGLYVTNIQESNSRITPK
jgi:hypothetical protein